jgi:hypothetical protein
MNRTLVGIEHELHLRHARLRFGFGIVLLLIWSLASGSAQDAVQVDPQPPLNIQATHLLGFEDVKGNTNGTLSIQNGAVQFQKDGQPGVQVKISSIQGVFLGEQSKQVGGVPMTLGKAAVPFGGGRVISLFSHKKYDTVTLDYVDVDGGAHGTIFQLQKGQGEIVKKQLAAEGAHITPSVDSTAKQEAVDRTAKQEATGAANEAK